MNLQNLNPFSSQFLKFAGDAPKKIEQIGKNSVGEGINDQPIIGDILLTNMTYGGQYDTTGVTFGQYFENKASRISQYRTMANYPEIASAIYMICDEAINENNVGDFISFDIKDTDGLKRKTIRDLKEEWNIVINELFNFKETGWELFKCFMVEAELYFEIVLSDPDEKGNQEIIAFKQLPAYTMTPVYKNGAIIKYLQVTEDGTKTFQENQILYVNYGEYGDNKMDIRGYLDPVIAIYNMIRNLEDSAVIAQIVRAPERRVFNIEVGKVSPGRAEQILQKTMHNYRKNLKFDPTTGLLNAGDRFQAMTEDFFFAKSDGQGSSVETLASGQNLEQLIELPNYFLRKMYKALHIPSTRWGGGVLAGASEGGQGQYNNKMDIEREELNFTKFIERLTRRFCKLFYKAFIFDITLKKFDPATLVPFNYNIRMNPNNQYAQYRELELMKEKLDMLSQYGDLRLTAENPNAVFANEYFLKNICGFTQSQLETNEDMKAEEKKELQMQQPEGEEVEFGGESDFGGGGDGGFGGSDFGGGDEGAGDFGGGPSEGPGEGGPSEGPGEPGM